MTNIKCDFHKSFLRKHVSSVEKLINILQTRPKHYPCINNTVTTHGLLSKVCKVIVNIELVYNSDFTLPFLPLVHEPSFRFVENIRHHKNCTYVRKQVSFFCAFIP